MTALDRFFKELDGELAPRPRHAVRLIAASKYFDASAMRSLALRGVRDFGENRLQEAVPKMEALSDLELNWHFIGHVQSNKARRIVERFPVIHSVDSLKTAREIDRQCDRLGIRREIFLQVNVAGETSKYGFSPEALFKDFSELIRLQNVSLSGLMVIAPWFDDPEDARPLFREAALLLQRLNRRHETSMTGLSMGMSADWRQALSEGATHLRIGRALLD
jgi:hypothetical protein